MPNTIQIMTFVFMFRYNETLNVTELQPYQQKYTGFCITNLNFNCEYHRTTLKRVIKEMVKYLYFITCCNNNFFFFTNNTLLTIDTYVVIVRSHFKINIGTTFHSSVLEL